MDFSWEIKKGIDKGKNMQQTPTLRVCYILKRYPRLSETFIVNEMTELRRQGVDITIVAHKDPGEEIVHEAVRALDVPVYYLSGSQSGHPRSEILLPREDIAAYPDRLAETTGLKPEMGERFMEEEKIRRQAAMIAPLIKNLGINHIHAHFATWATTAASYLSEMTGIPFSFTAHAKDIYHEEVNRKALAEKIEKARFVITVSDYNKAYLDDLVRSKGRSGKIIRIYNGIDLELFKPSKMERAPDLLVAVGRLVQKKGFHYLIDACKILKERERKFQCLIIGEGGEREALQRRIVDGFLEKEVSLLGAKPQTEVIQILRKATALVLPCVVGDDGDRDGLPTVLLEAMALGVPVISTWVTGIPEIIQNGKTGILVEQKDPRHLAGAIENILDSGTLRKKFSIAAMKKVRVEFDLHENVKTMKGYINLLGSLGHPSSKTGYMLGRGKDWRTR